jgi:Protein of unknown function (DUF3795)
MTRMMSACGVLCSGCPAFRDKDVGIDKVQTAAKWRRVSGLKQKDEDISCGGCLGPDDQLFHTCRKCEARQCCRKKGLRSCAECFVKSCALLEKAQAQWDGVAKLVEVVSRTDFAKYAKPFCDHRQRLERARRAGTKRKRHSRSRSAV